MNWKVTQPKEETMREFKEYPLGGEVSQEALDIAEKHMSPAFTSGLNGTTAEDIIGSYADKPKRGRKPAIERVKVDVVNQPPHYTTGGIETIDFIEAKLSRDEYIGYLKGNVLKYASRLGHKGDAVTDAGKLNWYTTRLARALGGE